MDPAALAKLIGEKYRAGTTTSSNNKVSSGQDRKFISTLQGVSNTVFVYENDDILDYALEVLPLERLYGKAEEREAEDPSWGLQDYLIQELLQWFKHDFFEWVNHPKCSKCGSDTRGVGSTGPTEEEKNVGGAGIVELSECTNCKNIERFPRYNKPKKLLETHQGRCGEWANAFTCLCRALGSRVRYIWNSEDHVWTEVYSSKQQRWVHADSCEAAWDKPTIYSDGWGKKMAYVIAFSVEGATDVTKRYVRDSQKALPRDKINENVLQDTLNKLTSHFREAVTSEQRDQLSKEDKQEEEELLSYQLSGTSIVDGLGPRESGSAEWKKSRGEDGK